MEQTRIVEERTIEDGNFAEISNNYFAICSQTNDIFYYGENTDFYENGKIISHNGSWQAGYGTTNLPSEVKRGSSVNIILHTETPFLKAPIIQCIAV